MFWSRRFWRIFSSVKLWLLIVLLSGTAQATTLLASDVLARARVYLRDQATGANRQQFPDSTLLQFLSDGQREANAQNGLITHAVNFLTTAPPFTPQIWEQALPSDFMFALRVWFQPQGTNLPYTKLDQTSLDQLDAQSTGWLSSTGPPTKYFIDNANTGSSSSSPFGSSIGFFPVPTVTSTGTAVVFYVEQTQDCTVTTCIPFNGQLQLQPYVSALAYYVAYRGFQTVEETDLAKEYLNYWAAFLQIMRLGTTKTPDFQPGFVGSRSP